MKAGTVVVFCAVMAGLMWGGACGGNVTKPPEEIPVDGRFVEEGMLRNGWRSLEIYCDTLTGDRIYLPVSDGGPFVVEDGCAEE